MTKFKTSNIIVYIIFVKVKKMDISKTFLDFLNSTTGNNQVISMIVSVILLVVGFILLIKGADTFVDGASKIAAKLNVPLIVIGLTIVAFGTSAPEAAISINSAFQNSAGIAVGNVIGSNILNILLILGIAALFTAVPVKKTTFKYEIPFVIAISAILVLLGIIGGSIDKIDSIILLVLFVAFFVYLILLSKKGDNDAGDDVPTLTAKDTVPKMIIFIILGLAAIVLGSDFTVTGATAIAQALNVDDRIIGLTIVAFGTSLPELVTSVTAAKKQQADIAIGNVVGSNIFNILFVIGLASLFSPNPINFENTFIIDGIVAILAVIILWLLVFKNKKISKAGGIIMLVSYAIYFAYLLLQPTLTAA